jgi:hypothetical protein
LVKLGYSLAKATPFPGDLVLDDELLKSACKEFLSFRDYYNKKYPSKPFPLPNFVHDIWARYLKNTQG